MGSDVSKGTSRDVVDLCPDEKMGTTESASNGPSEEDIMHAWTEQMSCAEDLYVGGRLRESSKVLQEGMPPSPTVAATAALNTAVARANVAICRLGEARLAQGRGEDGPAGGVSRGDAKDAIGPQVETREEAIASLEDALDEVVELTVSAATCASERSSLVEPVRISAKQSVLLSASATSDGDFGGGGDGSRRIGVGIDEGRAARSVLPGRSGRRAIDWAAIASATEDVAVQVACSILADRLAWGEVRQGAGSSRQPSKAVATGVSLLARRRIATSAGGTAGGHKSRCRGQASPMRAHRRANDARLSPARRQATPSDHNLEAEEEHATDVFFGADDLRDAFDSTLQGWRSDGQTTPLHEAAPRLLHLIRFSWLLATANLALGRAAAAARLVAVAEHAYGARRSAWRRASMILASSRRGASGWRQLSSALGFPSAGGGGRVRSMTGDRDPALAMCRFLRALSALACGEQREAAEQLEASIELDPSDRQAFVCLAHLCSYAQASCSQSATPSSEGAASCLRRMPAPGCWRPSDSRTREVLRVLAHVHLPTADAKLELGSTTRAAAQAVPPQAFDGPGAGGGVEAFVLLGCSARASGDLGGAVSMFERALALDPDCLEAVYGVARVLQESSNDAASRKLLLYLGQHCQELLAASKTDLHRSGHIASARSRGGPSSRAGGASGAGSVRQQKDHPNQRARLCFVLGDSSRTVYGLARSPLLPAALAEVMWRVARTSMAVRDWGTAVAALKGLVADVGEDLGSRHRQFYYTRGAGSGDERRARSGSSGPGRARVLRALAFCQLQQKLFADALETTRVVLGDGASTSTARDAAMMMLRADALLCLEADETLASTSLERATQLLNLRRINMGVPSEESTSSSTGTTTATSRSAVLAGTPARETSMGGRESVASATRAKARRSGSSTRRRHDPSPMVAEGDTSACGGRAQTSSATSTAEADDAGDAADSDGEHDRDRRLARAAVYNNRAVLLIAGGRGDEGCQLLRASLALLPGEPRPAFNLALALWRLGRPMAACAHWLSARGWLNGENSGDVETWTQLLESARRRKASLEADAERRRAAKGWDRGDGPGPSASHVAESPGDPLSVAPLQMCLLDVRSISWWLDNGMEAQQHKGARHPASASNSGTGRGTGGSVAAGTGLRSLLR